jgi:excinuclease ABC subunit B
MFEETKTRIPQVVYVSATPSDYERKMGKDALVELIVRPTGLIDPTIVVRSAKNQVDDLFAEINIRQKRNERVLVTTLTKRMAEDLTEYYADLGTRVRYLHSDINTLERMDIIQDLRMGEFDVLVGINLLREGRMGEFDVLVGINLLREGLDIPEVSLVAILDADKEGFLRSARSLIQTCGRAARNVRGTVIMYADVVTRSMQQAIDETNRRREIQQAYNHNHNIIPETIQKEITRTFDFDNKPEVAALDKVSDTLADYTSMEDLEKTIKSMEAEMQAAAKELEFERAAKLRDRVNQLKKIIVIEA